MDEHGLDERLAVPDARHDLRGAAQARPRGRRPSLFTAFNRWLDEDWGFAYQDRIFAAPYITLADVDWAVAELEWALDRGARTDRACARPRRTTADGRARRRPTPMFDPFWARVNEAGITVVVHAGDSGYSLARLRRATASPPSFGGGGRPDASGMLQHRAADRTTSSAALVFDKLFDRFPNLRVASVENGSEFLPDLFQQAAGRIGRKMPGCFPEDPVETFRRHVWINPFWEDDVDEIVELMGADRVDVRLRLAPHRGHAAARSTTWPRSRSSTSRRSA